MNTISNYQNIISQAWVGMAIILIMMQITDLVEAGMKNDYSEFTHHLKMKGLWILSIMAIINVIIQNLVKISDYPVVRWVVLIVSILYTLFHVIHQLVHLISGDKFDIHFCFDITHHALGITAIIFAIKWIGLF